MKVGDKLLCIKDSGFKMFGVISPEVSGTTHIKDKFYTIFGFETKSGNYIDTKDTIIFEKNTKDIYVEVEPNSLSAFHSFLQNPDPNKQGYFFSLEPSEHMFSEHFTTVQELRKQKLRKINREYRNNK